MERVWLITGASSGFGRQIATAALDAGDRVIAAMRRPEALDELAASSDGRLTALALDVTDLDAIGPFAQQALALHGHVDVLVNNAGTGMIGAVEDTSDTELRQLMELHFFGPVALTKALLPAMRERGEGTIVQMSSQGGRLTFPGVGAYCATKYALEGWSETLAQELEPFGIRVMIVEPGAFRTSFNTPGALRKTAISDPYREAMQTLAENMAADDGKQPGDPARAAAAIVSTVAGDSVPLRLPLGSDAVEAITTMLDDSRAELGEWESVSRGADFGDA